MDNRIVEFIFPLLEFFFSQYLELEDKINKSLGNFWYCNSWYDKLILGIFQLLRYWNKFDKIVWSVLIAIHENIKKKKKNQWRYVFKVITLVVNKQRLNNRKIKEENYHFYLSIFIDERKHLGGHFSLSSRRRIMNRFIAKRHIWRETGRDEMMNW